MCVETDAAQLCEVGVHGNRQVLANFSLTIHSSVDKLPNYLNRCQNFPVCGKLLAYQLQSRHNCMV